MEQERNEKKEIIVVEVNLWVDFTWNTRWKGDKKKEEVKGKSFHLLVLYSEGQWSIFTCRSEPKSMSPTPLSSSLPTWIESEGKVLNSIMGPDQTPANVLFIQVNNSRQVVLAVMGLEELEALERLGERSGSRNNLNISC